MPAKKSIGTATAFDESSPYVYPSAAEVLDEFKYLQNAPNPQYNKTISKKTSDFKNQERFVSKDEVTSPGWKSGKLKYTSHDIAAFPVDESTTRADGNGVGPNNSKSVK